MTGSYGKEALELEFKSDRDCLGDTELLEAIVGLANSNGGRLYLGVEDDGTPTGLHPKHANTDGLAAFIANNTRPSLRVTVRKTGNPEVIEITVPKASTIVSTESGRALRRRIKHDGTPEAVPLYPYEMMDAWSDLRTLDFSAQAVPEATRDDFDPLEREHLRKIIAQNPQSDRALLELSDEELEHALGLVSAADNANTPTLTGLLLLGKEDSLRRLIPTHAASFQVLEGSTIKVNRDFHGPLLQVIEQMGEMLEPWNTGTELTIGLFSKIVPDFNRRAFREAIVNAFGHRDYSVMGRVVVKLDDWGLEISSRGSFIEGISIDNLLTADPHGRNTILMDALKRSGLAERTGRGIDRIFAGSLNYGRPLPDYSNSNSQRVSVFIPRSAPDPLFVEIIEEERERTGKELPIESLLILNKLKAEGNATYMDMADTLDILPAKLKVVLKGLTDSGLIEASGSGETRSYMLGSKVYRKSGKSVEYVRQSAIDRIRYPELILKLATEQGQLTTTDVERLLGVSHNQAYYQINKLVAAGTLRKIGSRRSAHYVKA
ncbi:RNA-binding domain-containing protein [Bifidobacterium cuniculi]|uniref:DNA-binding protein n=1 Tax=Bifidobacterium cuniculi TaxID=1688 RepID=A0A087ATG8_9BIFI|nr:RNA-binding domain-containing protein [Bifidobacterium cuniculi]KFI62068.1 DNA-binding protein [Bifidobacterium cuniculi]